MGGGLEPRRQRGAEPHADSVFRLHRRELGDRADRSRAWHRGLDPDCPLRRARSGHLTQRTSRSGGPCHGSRDRPDLQCRRIVGCPPDRDRRRRLRGSRAAPARAERRGDRLGAACPGPGALMKPYKGPPRNQGVASDFVGKKPLYLKPRGAGELVPREEIAVDAPEVSGKTPLDEAQFVALDVETTGNAPFLVLEIGAERFRLDRTLSFFDTLVDCRAPINPYARRRHHIDRSMLIGAPEFKDARRAFLRFAQGAVLVEHSHDAFDTWLVGRGLESPLEHPIIDTSALARLVLDLPKGQTPGLARLVEELDLDVTPAHAALDDARATAMVFRALIARARETLGWNTVGDVLAALPPRPVVDRTPPNRRASAAGQAQGAPGQKGQPRSAAPLATRRATSPAPTARRGRSSRRRRSGSSGSPGGSPA